MSKYLIATFGWTEQFVLSSILKYGIEAGDKIILLVPDRKDERSEIVLRDFESFLEKYGERIELKIQKIPVGSFEEAVSKISEIFFQLLSRRPEKVIVNLSGGMRILILATYTAVQLTCPKDTVIELETEDRSKCYHIPNLSLKNFIKLTETDQKILQILKTGGANTIRLLRELQIPKSTLHKRLRELKSKGLIHLEKKGRTLHASVTTLGKLLSTTL